MKHSSSLRLLCLISCFLVPQLAKAALGDPEAALYLESAVLGAKKAELHAGPTKALRVHTAVLPSAQLKQFIYNGKVFAVAWNGLKKPDLTVILGTHHAKYLAAKRSTQNISGQKFQRLEQENFIYQGVGHMRSFRGYAYLSPLPPGIKEQDLR
jgi:hypothetical protein